VICVVAALVIMTVGWLKVLAVNGATAVVALFQRFSTENSHQLYSTRNLEMSRWTTLPILGLRRANRPTVV